MNDSGQSVESHSRSDASILTQAIVHIAKNWKLSDAKLAATLGLSASTVSLLRSGKALLDPQSKSFEAAQFLLRLYLSLDPFMGHDDHASQSWLRAHNLDLNDTPLNHIETFRGLIEVCDYVDSHRAGA